jgi:GH15 family glucan-1,4-alpha-glucosidase
VSAPLEEYALIGDCESAALVSLQGSIDWLCWPRFDSDACFAALLGEADNGRWLIAPQDASVRISRRYRGNTLIVETLFETDTGRVRLVDFMPPRDGRSDLVRLVIGEQGRVAMHTELIVRFGYGIAVPWVTREGEKTWRMIAGPDMVTLTTPVDLHGENLRSVADFVVTAGEVVPFTLTYSPSYQPPPKDVDVDAALRTTEKFWTDWAARSQLNGSKYSAAVMRSLLTLRALIYAPTGGIVAAVTTSLPERIGGDRNWDYRFCWLRDATLTLLALMDAGYHEEAGAWRDWLIRAIAGSPEQMQIMYGVAGERRLSEWEVPWLAGYEKSQPVRIGNAAHAQLQLDVGGELMDALHQTRKAGLPCAEEAWATQRVMLKHLAQLWKEPDQGIWETRSPARHFTYSKVMCWVAFDRAVKDVEGFQLDGPVDEWRALRDTIHEDVCRNGFDVARNTFVQSYGDTLLDASLLLLPAVGFLPADDPRIVGTIAAIEKTLLRDGLVMRYNTAQTDDGLPPGEGAFLACSFWLADAYAMSGRMEEAEELFERLLKLRNPWGLLSEEYDVHDRRLVGNFPQAFSHVALIVTAFNLMKDRKPAEQRSERAVPDRK